MIFLRRRKRNIYFRLLIIRENLMISATRDLAVHSPLPLLPLTEQNPLLLSKGSLLLLLIIFLIIFPFSHGSENRPVSTFPPQSMTRYSLVMELYGIVRYQFNSLLLFVRVALSLPCSNKFPWEVE